MDYLNIDLILSSSDQPRTVFDPNEMDKLAESIKEYGILEPLLVAPAYNGNYHLVAGERRLRAARKVGLDVVPVVIRDVFSDAQKMVEIALIENIQRVDLNPLEKARAYQHLVDEYGLTHDELAAKMSVHRSTVSNTLRLLKLPEKIQTALLSAAISERQAMSLLALYDLPEPLLKKAESYIYSADLHPTEIVKKVMSGASSDYVRDKINSILNTCAKNINWPVSHAFAVPDDRPALCADCEMMIYREANNLCGDESCYFIRLQAYHKQRLPLPEPTPTPAASPVPFAPVVDKRSYPIASDLVQDDDDDEDQEGETEIQPQPVTFSYTRVPVQEPETFAEEKAIEGKIISTPPSAPAEHLIPWDKCELTINLEFSHMSTDPLGRLVKVSMQVNGKQMLFDINRQTNVLMPGYLIESLKLMEQHYNKRGT